MRRLALTTLLVFAAASAHAQDRAPAERQTLLDLAYVIGESHALRQVCKGADDQFWRSRMVRLTEVEQADQGFDAQMRERFNTGFAAKQGEYPTCDSASRLAERQSAVRGQALAAELSRSVRLSSDPGLPPGAEAPEISAQ